MQEQDTNKIFKKNGLLQERSVIFIRWDSIPIRLNTIFLQFLKMLNRLSDFYF